MNLWGNEMKKMNWQECFSMNDIPEISWLETQAETLYNERKRDLNILEIGSYHGQSTVCLSQFGTVLSIDLFADLDDGLLHYENIGQGHFVDFIKNVIRFKLIDRILPMISTSSALNEMPNMEFDLIFIDACHTYTGTKIDLNNSVRHLLDDGYLICHDYRRSGYARPPYSKDHPHHTFDPRKDPWWQVAKAVDEFIGLGEFGISEHYCGIVKLQRVEYIKEVKVWP